MTTNPHSLTHVDTRLKASKTALALLLALTLSACSSTAEQTLAKTTAQAIAVSDKHALQTKTDTSCQDHAKEIANHAESVASTAQYLAAAKAMNNCISTALQQRAYNNGPAQQETIMKMMAVATLNFIKAGDVITAAREVDRFKRVYPQQDLYFADYTSFLDTATALLSTESLGASQISSLNISRVLRDEIERKHYWLNH
jgi:hypothetical protein